MATDQSRTPSPEHPETETLMARQYGRDVQHIVFGLHGTANNPGHVRPLTEKVGTALSNTPNSGTTIDTTFDWSKRAGFLNQPGGREQEGDRFAQHVDNVLTEMKKNGQLDPNKPVQITVVGFSHGGNVAIAATPELAEVMRKHGLNDKGSLHLVTVSAPAYNDGGNEDPAHARREAAKRGLDVHHTHFSPKNDGVIRLALGNAYYDGPGHPNKNHRDGHVYNYPLEGKGFLNPIGSHGAAQDDAATVRNINNQGDKVANIVAARTLDIHNRNGRPRPGGRLVEGDDGVELASAQPKTAEKTDQYRETSVVSAINAVRTPAAQEASVVAPISVRAQPNAPANPHPSQELLASPGVTDRVVPVPTLAQAQPAPSPGANAPAQPSSDAQRQSDPQQEPVRPPRAGNEPAAPGASTDQKSATAQDTIASPGVTDRIAPAPVVALDTPRPADPGERMPLISDPRHPDRAMYAQAYDKLGELGIAFKDDDARRNAAAALVSDAKKYGMESIDHVMLNRSGGVIAVSGALDDPGHKRFGASLGEITAQSVETSSQKLQQDAYKPAQPSDAVAQNQDRPAHSPRMVA